MLLFPYFSELGPNVRWLGQFEFSEEARTSEQFFTLKLLNNEASPSLIFFKLINVVIGRWIVCSLYMDQCLLQSLLV